MSLGTFDLTWPFLTSHSTLSHSVGWHHLRHSYFDLRRSRIKRVQYIWKNIQDYCCKKCYWTKQLLAHLKTCADYECMRELFYLKMGILDFLEVGGDHTAGTKRFIFLFAGPGCTPSKTLLMHVNNCRPVDRQCKQCTKMPEAGNQLLYRGRVSNCDIYVIATPYDVIDLATYSDAHADIILVSGLLRGSCGGCTAQDMWIPWQVISIFN